MVIPRTTFLQEESDRELWWRNWRPYKVYTPILIRQTASQFCRWLPTSQPPRSFTPFFMLIPTLSEHIAIPSVAQSYVSHFFIRLVSPSQVYTMYNIFFSTVSSFLCKHFKHLFLSNTFRTSVHTSIFSALSSRPVSKCHLWKSGCTFPLFSKSHVCLFCPPFLIRLGLIKTLPHEKLVFAYCSIYYLFYTEITF